MSVALVGRIPGKLCAALAFATACGGHSIRAADDGAGDGSSDDGSGDDGSSDDGAGGSGGTAGRVAVGGTTPAGGTSHGGTGQGGIPTGGFGGAAPMGGASGSVSVGGSSVGGSDACGDCPEWAYGLAIEGDGLPYAMNYNGYIPAPTVDREARICTEAPLRGSIGGCGYFDLHACAGPLDEPPCLEITSGTARYLDRLGRIWSGVVTTIASHPSIPGVAAGTLMIEPGVTDGFLALRVDYGFCTGNLLRVVCR